MKDKSIVSPESFASLDKKQITGSTLLNRALGTSADFFTASQALGDQEMIKKIKNKNLYTKGDRR